jgi:HSP20 family protein
MKRALIPTLFDVFNEETFPSLFNKALTPAACGSACSSASSGVNLIEEGDSFVVKAEVPGIKPDQIKILYDNGGVSIEAKQVEEKNEAKYHIKSSSSRSYWIPLPLGQIDESASPEAICENGILKITFAKSRSSRPLKIAVKGA